MPSLSQGERHRKAKALLCHCPEWYEVRREIPGAVTENGKEGKSKMIASCGFLEDELRQYSKEGVTMADSVETLAVHLRTKIKRLGAKEKARRKKGKVRFSLINKNKAFQKSNMEVWVKKLSRAGMVPARAWRGHAVEMVQQKDLNLRRQQ